MPDEDKNFSSSLVLEFRIFKMIASHASQEFKHLSESYK